MKSKFQSIPKKISIVTPAPVNSQHGNRITALRWQKILSQLNYSVQLMESFDGKEVNLLIALHAHRSHRSIADFKKACPNQPIILVMTGTDLYRDIKVYSDVYLSMQLADRIVLLQPAAVEEIPQDMHHKVCVIYQSVRSIKRKPLLKKHFLISLIGHLRPEKDPFCTVRSLPYIPTTSKIQIQHLGKAMSEDMAELATQYSMSSLRYRWLKELKHSIALQKLARSHLMVISSLMEGGAHVVSEAIAIGVPVIASDIPGNRGLLGENYLGYYPVGDEKALAKILFQAETDRHFYVTLEEQVKSRQKLVDPAFEKSSIESLLQKVFR